MRPRDVKRRRDGATFLLERSTAVFGFVVFGAFSAILVLTGIAAVVLDSQSWFELAKAGFYVLGASVTTVIGYYFGSKGAQEREAQAREREKEAEEARAEAAQLAGANKKVMNVQEVVTGPVGGFGSVRPPNR